MTVSSELIVGPRCLTVRLSGVMEPSFVRGAERMFREHFEACARQGLAGLLYDVRGVESRLGTLDVYEVAKSLASVQAVGIRIAIVARPEQLSPERFFEQVALNRGAPLKLFTREHEAMEWLGCSGPTAG